jgi:hypothetical protein
MSDKAGKRKKQASGKSSKKEPIVWPKHASAKEGTDSKLLIPQSCTEQKHKLKMVIIRIPTSFLLRLQKWMSLK